MKTNSCVVLIVEFKFRFSNYDPMFRFCFISENRKKCKYCKYIIVYDEKCCLFVYVGCLSIDTVNVIVRKMVLWRVLCRKKSPLVFNLRRIINICEPIMEKFFNGIRVRVQVHVLMCARMGVVGK